MLLVLCSAPSLGGGWTGLGWVLRVPLTPSP
ncbi:hypothetical protein CGRA01v4_08114 [Colletotrichum graminicola]|nr:hypothetical protein CGRA01v4_08114 [Colletotrichum graminicola]